MGAMSTCVPTREKRCSLCACLAAMRLIALSRTSVSQVTLKRMHGTKRPLEVSSVHPCPSCEASTDTGKASINDQIRARLHAWENEEAEPKGSDLAGRLADLLEGARWRNLFRKQPSMSAPGTKFPLGRIFLPRTSCVASFASEPPCHPFSRDADSSSRKRSSNNSSSLSASCASGPMASSTTRSPQFKLAVSTSSKLAAEKFLAFTNRDCALEPIYPPHK